ncbi:SDR family NAD(P)-dependent oxidoreductase [Zavarzinia sp.]|uniref:SDR family NAD(P)-dependent oxidoreductase n=1 Tax=Zavarzinia sp. TaxID=2027920 RepID=UPI00356838CD
MAKPPVPHPRSILITGASRGIGAALAEVYAAPGVTLAITGRDAAALATRKAALEAKGARVLTASFDVTDAAAQAAFFAEADAAAPLDLVIANAGVGDTARNLKDLRRATRHVLKTNVDGAIETALLAVETMAPRGRGQIGLVASIASFQGLPGAAAYCASKAAVRVFGEGLRADVAKAGIGVTVICPGFVATDMTAKNDFPMPFIWPADKAARVIARGLSRNAARVAFPWPLVAAMKAINLAPQDLIARLMMR